MVILPVVTRALKSRRDVSQGAFCCIREHRHGGLPIRVRYVECELGKGYDPAIGITGINADALDGPAQDEVLRRCGAGKVGKYRNVQ